jgi:uridine kinase
MSRKPFLILVAGGTSSGKGTLAAQLSEKLANFSVSVIGVDDYTSVELKKGVPRRSLSREQQDKEKKNVEVVVRIEHD